MASELLADYALLSDCHSAALVGGTGSIDWYCVPRFDSGSIFAGVLDDDAGSWSIRPTGEFETRRRYLPDTLVLETQFATPSGTAMLTDALLFGDHDEGHDIGATSPHVLARVIEVTNGSMSFDIELTPRPEYGIVHPRLTLVDGGLRIRGGADVLMLSGPAPLSLSGDRAMWELRVEEGDAVAFALHHGSVPCSDLDTWSQRAIRRGVRRTAEQWRSWSSLHQGYDGPWADLVKHSGRVLQGLTFKPTGAIVAAPTTSLPETRGGSDNWDYRYGWLRDVSLTMSALWIAACPEEADRFLRWLLDTAGTVKDGAVQVVYGIAGEHDLSERQLPHLAGWDGSRPVRIGNEAWRQSQLDVYGELLDAVHRLHSQIGEIDEPTAAFVVGLANAAAAGWREPDHSIWELRGPRRHYLYSKLMCWVALDRAIALAPWMGCEHEVEQWIVVREEIREEILVRGWNEAIGAFTQHFGSEALDASALMLTLTGFLPATDARMLSTMEAITAELTAPCGLLYRFSPDPSSPEGTFVLCTYWLVECRALAGQLEQAIELFERVTAYANDVGLLSEQIDPLHGELVGNFPQAFSHVGLINAAWAIAQEVGRRQPSPSKQ